VRGSGDGGALRLPPGRHIRIRSFSDCVGGEKKDTLGRKNEFFGGQANGCDVGFSLNGQCPLIRGSLIAKGGGKEGCEKQG